MKDKSTKKERLLRIMGDIDDKFVDEGKAKARPFKARIAVFASLAACLAILITTLGVYLFTPFDTTPPDVSEYSDSEYYALIESLNQAFYEKPRFKNNFGVAMNAISNFFNYFKVMDMAPSDPGEPEYGVDAEVPESSINGGEYVETTDNQVAGIIETDLLKRSTEYAFYLDSGAKPQLLIYSIKGEESQLVGNQYLYLDSTDAVLGMYLSKDCKTVTVIFSTRSYYNGYADSIVTLLALDVSDPTQIKEKNRVTFSGVYTTSRMADGDIILMTNYRVGADVDFNAPETFVPWYTEGADSELLPMDDIVCGDSLTSYQYTVISLLDADTLEVKDSHASLQNTLGATYVSADSIYVSHLESLVTDYRDAYTVKAQSRIIRISYADGKLEYKGEAVIDGNLKDQYSLDEYKGILRAVTTISENAYKVHYDGDYSWNRVFSVKTTASLYCIDIETMQTVSSVECFAPAGESVRSVRFDGDKGYVCTAIQLTDPVFFFDLSDVNNITYKETGTIEGFSSSLIQLKDGYLLGIGVGNSSMTFKAEIYKESEHGVISVAVLEFENTYAAGEYKSYLIDRENNLFGIPMTSVKSDYVLLGFDGKEITVRSIIPVETGYANMNNCRAFIDGGYLYVFSGVDFSAVELFAPTPDAE